MKINSEVTQTPTGDVDTSYWTMFKNDARHSLRLASVVCAIMAITSSLVVFYLGERDYRIHHSIYETHSEKMVLFQYLVYFSLAISLPVALDMIMTFFFTESNFEEMIQPRDFSRRFMLLIITLPNIFIATELIPGTCVDIVMYYQFTLSYLVIVYRLYSLSSAQKVISFSPLRDIFLLLMLSNFAGFLYDLSLHNIIGGRMAWKIVFSVSMILSQVATLFKVAHWLKFSNRIFAAATNQQKSSKGTLYGLLLAIVMSVCMIVIYLVWYNQEVLFFPKHFESYYALEAIFCFILLIWTAVRNFEVKKSENATKKQLEYNRKMTRSISHEIRTPLNTAFMALELLVGNLKTPFSPEMTIEDFKKDLLEIADSVKEGCDISLSILNQLLTFEKLSAGMMQLENKLISVDQLLDGNMKLFKMQAQQLGINFRLDTGTVDPNNLHVFVDEHKMNQVIRNLLSNGMKFTPKGGVVEIKLKWLHPQDRAVTLANLQRYQSTTSTLQTNLSFDGLEIGCLPNFAKESTKIQNNAEMTRPSTPLHEYVDEAQSFGTLLISIVDSGPGVSKDDQQKLFQEYVQINPGELQKGQGTGLGLSISKAIVQLHGGSIGMVSEGKGTGSTFYVELPLYRKTDLDDSRYDNSEMSGRSLASLHSIFIPSKLARESSKKFAAMIRASSARSLTIHPRSGAEIKPFSPLKKNKPPTVDILTLDDRMELGEAGGEDSKPVFTPQQEDERITSVVNLINNAFTTALRDGNGMEAKLSSKFRRNSSMAPKLFKILLVDDSVPNRKMLSRLLQREGHTVIEVGDGTEAVEVVRNKMNEIIFLQHGDSQSVTMNLEDEEKSEHNSAPFDFILMDYFMIKMNGPEAAREIRKLGYKNPIIGVTGVVGDDSVEFVKAGADLVLSKPVTVLSIWKGLHSLDFF